MAHELQDRYSKLVDAKLRATLVKKDVYKRQAHGNAPRQGITRIHERREAPGCAP